LTQHNSGLRLVDLTPFEVRHGSSMFFRQRRRLPVSGRTIRQRAEPLSQLLRATWREARGPKGQALRTPMDSATSRPTRRPRRRYDGVDADCAGAAKPSRGGNCCAAGHRNRAAVAAVSWLVDGNPPSRFWTGAKSTGTSPRFATSAASRRRLWRNGAYDQEIPAVVRGASRQLRI
jgi:hypothetical protein